MMVRIHRSYLDKPEDTQCSNSYFCKIQVTMHAQIHFIKCYKYGFWKLIMFVLKELTFKIKIPKQSML